jgi:ATP-dependent Clp protease ATP-binding subunit ClpA
MDHATLTDNNGRKADFRNVILVMTTNAGAQELSRAMIGFHGGTGQGNPKNVLERMFAPEFRNRLSATIEFAPLSPPVMERVVDKFIAELQERLDKQKVRLTVTPAAKKWLAEHGHDPRFGARPLGRLIENEIARELADQVLFGKLTKGGKATADLDGDKLAFSYEPNPTRQPAPVA